MKTSMRKIALAASVALPWATMAAATDLEVTHWWTSGGEAAAVAEFANAFNENTDHNWVDGAIAGGGSTARPVMVSRIIGGDPMGAFQFNHGRQAEELIEAGVLRDLTELAEAEGWRDIINPPSLLDSCTVDGKIYCVPVNIHSWQWLWLSNKAFEDAGVDVPTNWDEYVAAAPALKEAGKVPLALGGQPWQNSGLFNVLMVALAGPDVLVQLYGEKDADLAAGEEIARVFKAAADARDMSQGSNVQDWNQATNLVITDAAGGQVMGDWAQGEFQVAEEVAGEDYTCLPGLGVNELISTDGDAFYFPLIEDPEIAAAQEALASTMVSPETQVAFNLKKGSLPIRGDIDLAAANDCMKKGLEILASGNVMPAVNQLNTEDTNNQLNDLFVEFFNDTSITVEDAQARFVNIVKNAD
ncbi:ABC transporter substrate-binding protein [Algicella marina]|uniref:Probable sugar-binding periplasmic protein n=1 Tax=Algicella marina TaxID=2683284 RepID=A0A6P1SWB0_9RHOB|nr:ABC transporter substrate-binding protein [Algicella marina]QHQ33940.1 extracellular solute-binding protein [Algicella marina]